MPVSRTAGSIVLLIDENGGGGIDGGDEAYDLDIAADRVTVRANTPAGLFAAVQTLRQLLPVRGAGDAPCPAAGSWTGRGSPTAA